MVSLFLLALGSDGRAGTPEVAEKKPLPGHSLESPAWDFVRDSIVKPVAPFEMVPGKDPNGWSFAIEPYLWAMGLSGTTSVKGLPAMNVSVDAKKVLQQLDWGVMGMGEIRKGRWGLLADGYYAELSSSGELGGVLYQSGSAGVQQGLASLSLAYRIIDDRRGFLDVYAGARYNYLGMDVSATVDQSGIQELSGDVTDRVAARIDAGVQQAVSAIRARVVAAVQQARESLAVELTDTVKADLTHRTLERVAADAHRRVERRLHSDLRDRRLGLDGISERSHRELRRAGLDVRKVERLQSVFRPDRGVMADYIRASIDLEIAKARGEVTSDLEKRANAAKANVSSTLASSIEEALPTANSADVWWVDPIIGLRGQVNFTRWLYLTAQADVGGFGAGSQITWNVIGALGVNFTRNVFAELGYRYMYVDYQNDNFLYQMNEFGIFSSLGFKF